MHRLPAAFPQSVAHRNPRDRHDDGVSPFHDGVTDTRLILVSVTRFMPSLLSKPSIPVSIPTLLRWSSKAVMAPQSRSFHLVARRGDERGQRCLFFFLHLSIRTTRSVPAPMNPPPPAQLLAGCPFCAAANPCSPYECGSAMACVRCHKLFLIPQNEALAVVAHQQATTINALRAVAKPLAACNASHEAALAACNASHEAALAACNASHEAALAACNAGHEAALAARNAGHEAALAARNASHEAKLAEAHTSCEARLAESLAACSAVHDANMKTTLARETRLAEEKTKCETRAVEAKATCEANRERERLMQTIKDLRRNLALATSARSSTATTATAATHKMATATPAPGANFAGTAMCADATAGISGTESTSGTASPVVRVKKNNKKHRSKPKSTREQRDFPSYVVEHDGVLDAAFQLAEQERAEKKILVLQGELDHMRLASEAARKVKKAVAMDIAELCNAVSPQNDNVKLTSGLCEAQCLLQHTLAKVLALQAKVRRYECGIITLCKLDFVPPPAPNDDKFDHALLHVAGALKEYKHAVRRYEHAIQTIDGISSFLYAQTDPSCSDAYVMVDSNTDLMLQKLCMVAQDVKDARVQLERTSYVCCPARTDVVAKLLHATVGRLTASAQCSQEKWPASTLVMEPDLASGGPADSYGPVVAPMCSRLCLWTVDDYRRFVMLHHGNVGLTIDGLVVIQSEDAEAAFCQCLLQVCSEDTVIGPVMQRHAADPTGASWIDAQSRHEGIHVCMATLHRRLRRGCDEDGAGGNLHLTRVLAFVSAISFEPTLVAGSDVIMVREAAAKSTFGGIQCSVDEI